MSFYARLTSDNPLHDEKYLNKFLIIAGVLRLCILGLVHDYVTFQALFAGLFLLWEFVHEAWL